MQSQYINKKPSILDKEVSFDCADQANDQSMNQCTRFLRDSAYNKKQYLQGYGTWFNLPSEYILDSKIIPNGDNTSRIFQLVKYVFPESASQEICTHKLGKDKTERYGFK